MLIHIRLCVTLPNNYLPTRLHTSSRLFHEQVSHVPRELHLTHYLGATYAAFYYAHAILPLRLSGFTCHPRPFSFLSFLLPYT